MSMIVCMLTHNNTNIIKSFTVIFLSSEFKANKTMVLIMVRWTSNVKYVPTPILKLMIFITHL